MTDEQLQRIHDIEYSCDSRAELAERIVGLEDKLAMYENDHQIALRTYGSWKRLKAEVPKLREENEKLREYLAVSIPLPLDCNRSAIHPDDIIGNTVGNTDLFGMVTEMHLTRYPRDGQPAVWVVRTEDDDGNVFPYVCWGGRCNAVHKQASQTYSAEYLETYDENKQLKAENAKLRELCIDFASMLTYAELDGLRVEATIGGVTKTYDASELCDKVEELFDEVC